MPCVILQMSCVPWLFCVVGVLSCQGILRSINKRLPGLLQLFCDSCLVPSRFCFCIWRASRSWSGHVQDGWSTWVDEASSDLVLVENAADIVADGDE